MIKILKWCKFFLWNGGIIFGQKVNEKYQNSKKLKNYVKNFLIPKVLFQLNFPTWNSLKFSSINLLSIIHQLRKIALKFYFLNNDFILPRET